MPHRWNHVTAQKILAIALLKVKTWNCRELHDHGKLSTIGFIDAEERKRNEEAEKAKSDGQSNEEKQSDSEKTDSQTEKKPADNKSAPKGNSVTK